VLLISGLTAVVPARQAMRTDLAEALRLQRKSGSFAG
jgi:hypothetical protein